MQGTSAVNFAQGRLACGADNREAKELLRYVSALNSQLIKVSAYDCVFMLC